jgi:membrane protein
MGNDGASEMVGAISYYVFLSIFPLLLGIISLLGLFLPQASVQETLFNFVRDQLPSLENFLRTNIEAIINSRGALGTVSIIGLIWSGSGMFGAIHRGINRAWGVSRNRSLFWRKARHVAMALSTGVFFLLSMGANALFSYFPNLTSGLQHALSGVLAFVFIFLVFLIVYKTMPDTKTYWRYVWLGALLSAALFELARFLSNFYFTRVVNYELVYGSISTVIILLVWIYYSGFILILGAEVSAEFSRMQRGLGPKYHGLTKYCPR